jgi:hypothetical protein
LPVKPAALQVTPTALDAVGEAKVPDELVQAILSARRRAKR